MMKLDEDLPADDVFPTGTPAEIISVNKIDGRVIASPKVGPVAQPQVVWFRPRAGASTPED